MRTREEEGGGREGGREGGRGTELVIQGLYPLYDTLKGVRGDLGEERGSEGGGEGGREGGSGARYMGI